MWPVHISLIPSSFSRLPNNFDLISSLSKYISSSSPLHFHPRGSIPVHPFELSNLQFHKVLKIPNLTLWLVCKLSSSSVHSNVCVFSLYDYLFIILTWFPSMRKHPCFVFSIHLLAILTPFPSGRKHSSLSSVSFPL